MIKSLDLTNFRNYKKYSIDFEKINIFIGQNGIGKTNILEAVWFLADGKSWRTNKDEEVINWGSDFAIVSTDAERGEEKKKLELIFQLTEKKNKSKTLKINGVISRLIDLLGQMPAILFSPESIQMIAGAPAIRRRFLDILLSQTKRQYALSLLEYFKVLKERNKLLFLIHMGKAKEDELDFWDEKLVSNGSYILKERKEAIKYFNININKYYQKISGKKEELRILYKSTIDEENYLDHLVGYREREITQEQTLHGPHRDDFIINVNRKDVSQFGSRGEFRSLVLALKLLELNFLKEKKGESPILLLDDIFSELDKDRRGHLIEIIKDQQTIISTTDLDHIEKDLQKKAKIIKLK